MLERVNSKLNLDFEKVSFYSVLLFAFAFPLSRAAISFFIFWFFLLVLFKRDYKTSFSILKENRIFIYIFLFLAYMFLTLFWTEDLKIGFEQARMFAYWILIPCLVILIKKEWLYTILNAFLLGMLLSEILAYGMFFELWTINDRSASYASPFMNHIHYSVFLAFTALVLFYRFLFEESSIKFKITMFVFFMITCSNLMFSIGRTGQVAFFVTLVIVFFIKYKINIKSLLLSVFALITMISIFYNTFSIFNERVNIAISDMKNISNQNYNSSLGNRVVYWLMTFDSLKENSMLGSGLGDFRLIAKKMIKENEYKGISKETKKFLGNSHYHSQYLMIIVQSGLVGLFLMVLLFYKLFRLKIDDLELKHISIIGFCVILISFNTEPLWILQFPLVLFLFITSLSIVASKKDIIRP